MTKKEIALQLARQYAGIEIDFFHWNTQANECRSEFGRKSDEFRYAKSQEMQFKAKMNTVEESKNMLGISSKQWYDAVTSAYIENSRKEELKEA